MYTPQPWAERRQIGECVLYLGDSLEVTQSLEAESVDAIVTDPPYMINFMGAAFDREAGNLAASVDFWRECLRVLKPGGHLLAFGATRTHHLEREPDFFEIAAARIAWIVGDA